ncbi:MAG: hypothetical protein AAGK97_12050, partial [Bacteroidota bacterium]
LRTPKTITQGANDWVANQENYVFLVNGKATNASSGSQMETKTTVNSNSTLVVNSVNSNDVIIRIARINGYIIMLVDDGAGFYVHRRFERNDMPEEIQVGCIAYTDWEKVQTYSPIFHNSNVLNNDLNPDPSNQPSQLFNPDMVAQFDYVRFSDVPSIFSGLDLMDENLVQDSFILTHLNYPSIPNEPPGKIIWKGNIDNDWNNPANWNGGQIPGTMDSVLIPNCDCPEVFIPSLSINGSTTIAALEIENGATLNIAEASNLNIESIGSFPSSILINHGTLNIDGSMIVTRDQSQTVHNYGDLNLNTNGVFRVE